MNNDSDRLDAIGEYGLCVVTHDSLSCEGWERTWVCQYGDQMQFIVMAPTIREAIDSAILDLATRGLRAH